MSKTRHLVDSEIAPMLEMPDRVISRETLEQLRSDTGDRFDVLRMGVESAWSELKAAFDTATGPITHEGEPPKQEGEPLKKTG